MQNRIGSAGAGPSFYWHGNRRHNGLILHSFVSRVGCAVPKKKAAHRTWESSIYYAKKILYLSNCTIKSRQMQYLSQYFIAKFARIYWEKFTFTRIR